MARTKLKTLKIVPMKVLSSGTEGMGDLGDFAGAVKVCARYGPGKNSGKTRCLQWISGPGYAAGPAERGDGVTDPKYFIEAARVRPDGTKMRRYRYRAGNKPLPYPPRTVLGRDGKPLFNPNSARTQALWDDLPPDVKEKVLLIVNEGEIKPLDPEELVQIPGDV